MTAKTFDIRSLFVRPGDRLKLAAEKINQSRRGLAALVVDENGVLIDIVTDGDIRRAILDGLDMDTPVAALKTRKAPSAYPYPVVAPATLNAAELLAFMRERSVPQVPLVDGDGRPVDVVRLVDLFPHDELGMQAVVMAGGLGQRLRPLTTDMPKPMLPVGNRPLLERTVEMLRAAGVRRVNVTTHYKAEKIREHFGDGRAFGVDIEYINEDTPLGTAGALSLLPASPDPLLVINGDVLTQVDFRAMLQFHREQSAALSVAVRKYDLQVPYGVLECEGAVVRGLREKPVYTYFVNAGIYLLEPEARALIPSGHRFDMTDLINRLIESGKRVVSFPVVEYWLDIGQLGDYERAQRDVQSSQFDQ